LGSFLWYRPGLCQCRFRKGYIGLYKEIATFSPAEAGFTAVSGCSTAAYHLRWLRHSAHPVESRRG
jgi:hypothetical protein